MLFSLGHAIDLAEAQDELRTRIGLLINWLPEAIDVTRRPVAPRTEWARTVRTPIVWIPAAARFLI